MGGLVELLERHGAAALDKQWAVNRAVGEADWALDLEAGRISFGGRRHYPVQVLGTESAQSQTWRWAWAQPAGAVPPRLLTCAARLRALGHREQIAELTEPQLPLDRADGHRLALIASGLCAADGYYRGPYVGGAVFVLLQAPDLRAQPTPSAAHVARVLTQLIALYSVNHRRAFTAYLEASGCSYQVSARGIAARTPRGEALRARFDHQDRLVDIDSVPGAAEHPPEDLPWRRDGRCGAV